MSRLKKALVTIVSVLGLSAVSPLSHAFADKIAIDPMLTYGESLSDSQFAETKRLLEVDGQAEEIEVKINELNGLLQDSYPYYQVYSSTYITAANNNGGVTVDIKTPETITSITEAQYRNAAITAGAVDVHINVASAVPVDGSGALAGVYKAFQAQGYELDNEARSVAQEELAVTSEISNQYEGDPNYSDDLLNAAIAEMKTEISQIKDDNQGRITTEQVNDVVINVVNNYNLNQVISQDTITQIQNFMVQFSNIELSQEQKDNLKKLGIELQNKGGALLDRAKTLWDKVDTNKLANDAKDAVNSIDQKQVKEDSLNIWDAIVQFFRNLFS